MFPFFNGGTVLFSCPAAFLRSFTCVQNGWQYTTVRDFFCGGFAMLTTSEQSKTQIELFLGEIGTSAHTHACVNCLPLYG